MSTRRFRRIPRSQGCPVCGKRGRCMIGEDVVLCMMTPSPRRCGDKGAGWLHPITGVLGAAKRESVRKDSPPRPSTPTNWSRVAERCIEALPDDCSLACELGISDAALGRMELGWSIDYGAYTFPMRDESDHIIGIRTRTIAGEKRAMLGSKNGLFVPRRLPETTEVYVCEGPTDCAGLLDCGVEAIGRPSNTAGLNYLEAWFRARPKIRCVTVCIDRDRNPIAAAATADGADRLLETLRRIGRVVRSLRPPPRCKDMRDWVRAGLTARGLRSISEDTDYGVRR